VGSNTVGVMDAFCECFLLSGTVCVSGRSFTQRSRIECGVSECDREASIMRQPCPLGIWECGFESLCGRGCLSLVSVV
jgi:hypothetical protein